MTPVCDFIMVEKKRLMRTCDECGVGWGWGWVRGASRVSRTCCQSDKTVSSHGALPVDVTAFEKARVV